MVGWFRSQLQAWGQQNLRDFPWRQTRDPYALLVAECLLQKTEAKSVVPVYLEVLARYPTLLDLAAADERELGNVLRPLGLHFRAERLTAAARALLGPPYAGRLPDTEAELLQLPGVGMYTARALLSQVFEQSAAVLDASVARILERCLGLHGGRVKSRDPLLWAAADAVAPSDRVDRWNLTLIDFGALVCRARSPHCPRCPLRVRCHFSREGPETHQA
ncbi:A/G-specific DNA glycosylase [Rubidibacter lacunae KORDI 51-2]|uniref:Adenine DNA glycosylase n=2 Tax=Rubidibacter TaxID=582491 RepID=U5DLD6_9CHRO|nr:A/G-specific DNA glycosylase [Rubidibacter lacunae KORDI 51-2]